MQTEKDPLAAQLSRARAVADDRYSEPLTVPELAGEACLSQFHFIRQFRLRFFETPHHYLVRRRVERAKELLALSEHSVTDICFEVGFESVGSFSRTFHRLVGWSPSIYRARTVSQRRTPRAYIPACCWEKFGLGRGAR